MPRIDAKSTGNGASAKVPQGLDSIVVRMNALSSHLTRHPGARLSPCVAALLLAVACNGSGSSSSVQPGAGGTGGSGGISGTAGTGGTVVDDGGPPIPADGSPSDSGDPVIEYPACGPDPLPAPCDASATTLPPAGSFGADGAPQVAVTTLVNPHATAPGPVSVYYPVGASSAPVLFFSHAYAATDPASYDLLFRHLSSTGFAVVHVPYPNKPAVTEKNADRYDCLWDGFMAAVAQYGSKFDLTHVGFFGHSFGGGATPEMARRAFVEQKWGTSGRFMFMLAPWYSWGTGHATLPADVRTVIEVYADDNANDHQIAIQEIWNKLPPTMEKSWIMVRTDVCGQCGLNAPHVLPMSGQSVTKNPEAVNNGYDAWGVSRRLDALAKYAFSGDAAAKQVAFGLDTSMGNWIGCGGRAVRPLESSMTTPITATCLKPLYSEADRCANADPGVTCP
jgi:hypothetical protein